MVGKYKPGCPPVQKKKKANSFLDDDGAQSSRD